MPAPRLRRVSSPREMEDFIDDYITQGYDLMSQGENSALLRRRTWGSAGGHTLWFLLTFWFTIGFGNLIYALIAHFNAEKVMLKIGQPGER